MTFQTSDVIANAQLDAFESTIGTAAVLKIRTGAQPANIAASDSGTVLATITLPSDWMAAAASRTKAKSGTWSDTSADNTGTAAHFVIYPSDGTTRHAQGSVGLSGSGADMIVDNTSFVSGQAFTVTSFALTAGNA